jgi:hypothetical protein
MAAVLQIYSGLEDRPQAIIDLSCRSYMRRIYYRDTGLLQYGTGVLALNLIAFYTYESLGASLLRGY